MKYAVFQTGGKQYKVSEGDIVDIEHLALANSSEDVVFSQVLLVADGENVLIGKPTVDGVTISAKLVEHMKGKKIRVAKFKSKVRHRRIRGHRQSLSRVSITAIGKATKVKKEVKESVEAKPKRTTKKVS